MFKKNPNCQFSVVDIPISFVLYTLLLLVIFSLVFTVFIFPHTFFPEKYFYDAGKITSLATSIHNLQPFSSYANTGRFYNLFGLENVVTFQKICTLFFLLYLSTTAKSLFYAFICVLVLSPCLIFFVLPTKDILVGVFFLSLVLFKRCNNNVLIAIITAFLSCYALFFRVYFFAIGLVFISKFIFEWVNRFIDRKTIFIILIIMSAIVFMIFKSEILTILSYLVNLRNNLSEYRLGDSDAQSAFINYDYSKYVIMNFIFNYIVSAFNLLFPLVFYFSLKSLFLCIINFVTFTLAIIQIRSLSSKQRTFSWLFFSHFFVSIIFEPDLGSYLRHQSIFMPIIIFPLIDASRFKQFVSISPSNALNSSAAI